jgi:hypothetical protein
MNLDRDKIIYILQLFRKASNHLNSLERNIEELSEDDKKN